MQGGLTGIKILFFTARALDTYILAPKFLHTGIPLKTKYNAMFDSNAASLDLHYIPLSANSRTLNTIHGNNRAQDEITMFDSANNVLKR